MLYNTKGGVGTTYLFVRTSSTGPDPVTALVVEVALWHSCLSSYKTRKCCSSHLFLAPPSLTPSTMATPPLRGPRVIHNWYLVFLLTRQEIVSLHICVDPRGSGTSVVDVQFIQGLPLLMCSYSLHLLKIDREDFAPQSGLSSSSNPT